MKTLEAIVKKFENKEYNKNNYYIGGGLSEDSFASRRHEDAKLDEGKLTLGEATQLFKKATGLPTEKVKEIIKNALPYMEWHHAGKLPKSYGGGMKKTYFVNSEEMVFLAKNWGSLCGNLSEEKSFEERKKEFLEKNAKRFERKPFEEVNFKLSFIEKQEMNGKYGWFRSENKRYNLREYLTGWEFPDEETLKKWINLQ